MTFAPLFSVKTQLGGAYRQWAEHYNACETCQRDDWYAPPLGEALYCSEGQRLFRTWVAAVSRAFTSGRQREESLT